MTFDGKYIWVNEDSGDGLSTLIDAYSPSTGDFVKYQALSGTSQPWLNALVWDGNLLVVTNDATIYTIDPGVDEASYTLSTYQVGEGLGTIHSAVVDENQSVYVVYYDGLNTIFAVLEGPEPNLHANTLRVENDTHLESDLVVGGNSTLGAAQTVAVSAIGAPGLTTLDDTAYRVVFTVAEVGLLLPAGIPVGRVIKIKDKSGLISLISASGAVADMGEDIDGEPFFLLTVPYEEITLTKDTTTSWSIG